MSQSSRFTIYNASAGSGKTFALVKSYLTKLLAHSNPGYFKHVLAITFTNKAVAEMKTRVIDTLVGFSSESVPASSKDMLQLIAREMALPEEEIRSRSRAILKHLLHNYAQFSVETIDHFNHRLIRTFARDLNLSTNFEVSLEVQQLIARAVDQLIEKAGEDKQITAILLEFALQKTDDDKSWDIAIDLKKAASLLTNENDANHLDKLREKSLTQFLELRDRLWEQSSFLKKELLQIAQNIMDVFSENQLEATHFDRKYAYLFFEKISRGQFDLNYNTAWQQNMGVKPMYPSRVKGTEAAAIDKITPLLIEAFQKIKERVQHYFLLQNILKNLVPLATVHLVHHELEQIKEEEEILPINEFNSLIHEQIKDQPAPFIYERLGDRYRDFFIDEFQDTSLLQWNNLIPLIENALSQSYEGEGPGSLLLVGDAKQSIYRWRGGLPEQFIHLYEDGDPFGTHNEKTIQTLPTNYRSGEEIISFNNKFFQFVSEYFTDPSHRDLYHDGSRQEPTNKEGGYVKIEFVEAMDKEDEHLVYSQKVYQTIKDVSEMGFQHKDLCILTRKRRDGIALSEFLLSNGVPVISEDTLLLNNSPAVRCLVGILQLSITPDNEEVKIELLEFLHAHLAIPEEKHTFFTSLIHKPMDILTDKLAAFDIEFKFDQLKYLSLFEACEYSIRALKLDRAADTFLFSFMDLVFAFSQRPESGKNTFIDHWELEKEQASISENKSANAVTVMTIHKAKGLEFPVVLFPYADLDLYSEKEPTAWYPFNNLGFEHLLINYNHNKVADYGEEGTQLVSQRRNTLELDNLNLLYVAMTRAEQQLYVFGKYLKGDRTPSSYNAFFKEFLKAEGVWDESQLSYKFGTPSFSSSEKNTTEIESVEVPYYVSMPGDRQIKISASDKVPPSPENLRAITVGNLLHDAMARVCYSEEMESVIQDLEISLRDEPDTFNEVRGLMTAIVDNPELKPLFQAPDTILNERDIITPERILRPDRINLHPDGTVTVVDYKTGLPKEAYEFQINSYAMALQDMGYKVREKLLVYSNNDGVMINKT